MAFLSKIKRVFDGQYNVKLIFLIFNIFYSITIPSYFKFKLG